MGIAGAGVMGEGIARVCLQAGLSVRLHDVDSVRAQRVAHELHRWGTHLVVASTPAEFAAADLVIESIPEDLAVKRNWLAEVEPSLPPTTLLATNTSSLPLASLSSSLRHPERFCGLHFCHPVSARPLVEVVKGSLTTPAELAAAVDFAARIGKVPIVVGDAPGFVLNRLLSLYLVEALELLLEGVEPQSLDAAAAQLGMPLGPLQQLDAFGVELALAIGRNLWAACPDRWIPSELLIALCKARRRDAELRSGLFIPTGVDCSGEQPAELRPHVLQLIQERRRAARSFSIRDIELRFRLPLLVEATRILECGQVSEFAAIDRILQLGLGMRRSASSLQDWAASAGVDQLLDWLAPLKSLGERFVPGPEFRRWIPAGDTARRSRELRPAA